MPTSFQTTHVGSLPRPQPVVDMLFAEDAGTLVDREAYNAVMREAVDEIVRQQVEAGVSIVSDGEMSKISYATYIRHRLTGFEIGEVPRATPWDLDDYPAFRDRIAAQGKTPKYNRPICRGEIAVKDLSSLDTDIANLKAAAAKHGAQAAFMNSASPGVIAVFQPNEYYPLYEEYLYALANAMKTEYERIVESGLFLQIDCPDLGMGRHVRFRDESDEAFVQFARLHIEALNHALQNVPADRVRMHLCWGNYEGPHHHDIGLEKVVDVVLSAKPYAVQFEAANPRHAHEWEVWAQADIPQDKVLIPGVLDSTNNYIEHPHLVAQRVEQFARIVGAERVIAGTDCGFGTFAGFGAVDPAICFAKLRAMREGADLAAERLAIP